VAPASSPVDTGVYHAIARLFWGSEEAGDIASYAGKPLAAVLIQDRVYVHDCLGLCNFTWPITYSFATPDHLGDSRLEGRLFSAVTGLPEDRIWEYGKRIVDLQRAILMREGRNIATADYPREHIFTEPLTPGTPQWAPGPNGLSMFPATDWIKKNIKRCCMNFISSESGTLRPVSPGHLCRRPWIR
jgi:aldehyde:ferredoxin oxidoreductase